MVKSKRSSTRRVRRRQRGGDGSGNQGHDVSFPIQFYGGKLDRYFPAGSSELKPMNSAYGPTHATSFGRTVDALSCKNMRGPDLGAYNDVLGVSGDQTGGVRRRRYRKSSSKSLKRRTKRGSRRVRRHRR